MGWNNSIFTGQVIQVLNYVVTVKFTSAHNNETWMLTTIYGPCQVSEREDFFLIGSMVYKSKMMIIG